ncbi:MAG: NnrS family protein [Neptuniibacter sp.]
MIPIQEKHTPHPFSLFNLGFRPFFLGGAVAATLLILSWLLMLNTGGAINYYQTPTLWHSHEMIFGYTMAIIAGFLLTAVKNWTNIQTLYSWRLALLFLLWLLARVVIVLPSVPHWLIAVIDLSFIPILAFAIALPIIRSQNYRNLVFIPVLSTFFIANLFIHAELNGWVNDYIDMAIQLALFLVIFLITVIGGRVIPFFTERGGAGISCRRFSYIEKPIIPLTLAWIAISLTDYQDLTVVTSMLLAVLNLIRMCGWYRNAILRVPLIWILQLSYLFIPIGLVLYGLYSLGLLNRSIALHAFTVGVIGGMTLGMMARVSLGHTGRALEANKLIITAFVLMLLAAVLRVSIDLLPIDYMTTINLTGCLWLMSWFLFLTKYISVLIKPRIDGLPG